jgi:molybdopterin molybdotransferase
MLQGKLLASISENGTLTASPTDVISEEEARRKILEAIRPLPERTVPLSAALGFFSAQDIVARLPMPVFDNSAMDGYAVVASSCKTGERLRVIGEQPAGVDRQIRVSLGEAARIFTGAPIPAGADAVVMQEDVKRDGDEIVLNVEVNAGEFVRRRGSDLSEGQKILSKGERIRAATLALLASQGFSEVTIGGEVDVAILSTGDELVKPGTTIRQGQIYDSNSVLLESLVQRCHGTVRSVENCPDDQHSLADALKRGIRHNILIISGGVSVGKHDIVKATLLSLGAKIDIWRVAIKPGKPFLFGAVSCTSSDSAGETPAGPTGKMPVLRDCFIFGLPGNPVSAFVTFLQFVRPAVLKMMGASDDALAPAKVTAESAVELHNEGERANYVRGRVENGKFFTVGRQESHALFGLSQANALLRIAPGKAVRKGATIDLQLLD